MTNAITTPKTADEIMAEYRAKLADRAIAVQNQITAAPTNVIRTKGRVFTMPDGTTNQGPLSCVILDFVSFNSLFKGAYNPQNPQPPVCWAVGNLHDMKPSASCPEPQNPGGDCAQCPKNQWGSATNGGKGKACKNQFKIALIPSDLKDADPNKIYTLNVSPTGMKVFSAYVRRIQKALGDDALPMRVVTEVSFDPAQAYPSLLFREKDLNSNLHASIQLFDEAHEMLMREPKAADEE